MSVLVISPHLDDAVLSLGATMRSVSRRGVPVSLVTVFAGDPHRASPPSYWDAQRGVATAGEASLARRAEDAAACAVLGVDPTWLPFDDAGYVAARDPELIWDALAPMVEAAEHVLVPGFPLSHADHRFVTMLLAERLGESAALLFYSELPYAAQPVTIARTLLRQRRSTVLAHAVGCTPVWGSTDVSAEDLADKREAVACYAGEIRALGRDALLAATHDRLMRREYIAHRPGAELPDYLGGGAS